MREARRETVKAGMEQLRDTELSIVGEAYASFSEAYRVNEARALNALYAHAGDRSADARAEVEPGTWFSPEQTKEALLFGYEGFSDAFSASQTRMERLVAERYEWREEKRHGTGVHGANVIVERVAAGHPETFTRPRRHMRKKRSAHIVYDTMCAASTPPARRVEAACAVMAAARALERMGYEVRLDFALAKFSGNSMADDATLLFTVALKGFGEPFVASRMEFPLAAKCVLFHLGCFWAHRFAGTPMDYGPGEGYPLSYDPRRVKAMEAFARGRGGVYLSEDIVEVQLGADPVRVLERVLGAGGDTEALALHVRRKTAMNVAANPRQGKLFSGVGGGGAGRGMYGEGGASRAASDVAHGEGGAPAVWPGGGDEGASAAGEQDGAAGESGGSGSSSGNGGGAFSDGGSLDGSVSGNGFSHGGKLPPAPRPSPKAGEADAMDADDARGGMAAGESGAGVPSPEAARGAAGAGGKRVAEMRDAADGGDNPGDAGVSFTRDAGGGKAAGADGGAARGDDADGAANDADGAGDTGAAHGMQGAEGAGAADERGAGGMGEQGEAVEESRDGRGKKAASTEADGRDEEAGAMAHEQQEPEPAQEERSLERDEDPFVVMLRKRFVRFEEGAYREQVQAERIRAEAHRAGRTPPAPPITAENSEGGFKLGAPRNTPFSISYVPKKK